MAGHSPYKRVNFMDDSFGSPWTWRTGSRAEQINHRKRPNIRHRYYSDGLDAVDWSTRLDDLQSKRYDRTGGGSTSTGWRSSSPIKRSEAYVERSPAEPKGFGRHNGTSGWDYDNEKQLVYGSQPDWDTRGAFIVEPMESNGDRARRSGRNAVARPPPPEYSQVMNGRRQPQNDGHQYHFEVSRSEGPPSRNSHRPDESSSYWDGRSNNVEPGWMESEYRTSSTRTPSRTAFRSVVDDDDAWHPVAIGKHTIYGGSDRLTPTKMRAMRPQSSHSYRESEHQAQNGGRGDSWGRGGEWNGNESLLNSEPNLARSASNVSRQWTERSSRPADDDGGSWQNVTVSQSRGENPSTSSYNNNGGVFEDTGWDGYIEDLELSPPLQTRDRNRRGESTEFLSRRDSGRSGGYDRGFAETLRPPPPAPRSSDRIVFDGKSEERHRHSTLKNRGEHDDAEFLGKIQKELENQRLNWKSEIDKLNQGTVVSDDAPLANRMSNLNLAAGKSSYVDTRSGVPLFKAFVDVKEFSPESVKVNFDRLTNKIVVQADQVNSVGSVGRTFTQKIQLPRFADDTRLSARMNSGGIMKIEVPLMYYFPEKKKEANTSKSFINEARNNPKNGSKTTVEIVVKPGNDISTRDLRVEVVDGKLVVWAVKRNGQKALIKRYTLPPTTDVRGLRSKVGKDGCLVVLVPVNGGKAKEKQL